MSIDKNHSQEIKVETNILKFPNSKENQQLQQQKKFELPISMSKTVEFYIQKAHEDYKTNGKKSK